ncbi:MAG: CotH kinase family protein, partial [Bacteroidales bacterium]|nr:CotH kinase family protein [Bacteroidales bacterium]
MRPVYIIFFLIPVFFGNAQKNMVFDTTSDYKIYPGFYCKSGTFQISDWQIKINEFCAKNESIIHDEYGEYDDWIEIYNFGDDTIDINGLYITDDLTESQKWQFTEELLILPDSFALIWADNEPEQGTNHVGFKLSGDGEQIGLYTPENLLLVDSIIFEEQISDVSMGRQPDGGVIWNNFVTPTPGSSNITPGMYGITPEPEFSVQGGFFDTGFYVTLNTNLDSSQIYYTIVFSEPTTSSFEYTDSILVNSTSIIRARTFKDEYILGYIATVTYVFNFSFTLDAISLVTEPGNLWGSSGIYDNPYSGIEKPIHFEYYKADGNQAIQLDCGVKIHAPDNINNQRSLRLYARSEYGDKEFNYQFFEDLDVDVFKRLILRNGGNDGFELGKTQIRDPLSHIIYKQSNPENSISSYKPVNVFLNGEYWGIYNLRERQDEYYIEDNFGEDNFDFLEYDANSPFYKNAITGDWQNFDSLKNFVMDYDLSYNDNYAIVKDWMDIENFVDYQIFEIFIGNQDWLSNNTRFWRPNRHDGKWKWVLWDTEYGLALFYPNFNIGYPEFNFLHMAMTWGGWGNGDYTYLLRNLTDNNEFLEYFNIRFADLLNTELKENGNIVDVIDSLYNLVYTDAQYQFNRWGGNNYSTWETKIQEIKNFTNGRPYYIREHIINEYGLNTLFTLNLDVQPANSGQIHVNTISFSGFPWAGQYFTDYITDITAIPNPGFIFEGWEGISSSTPNLMISSLVDTSFTALFQENPVDTSLIINEINYNSADFFDSDDWVELKNISSLPVNLSGWVFKDANDEHIFEIPDNFILEPESYFVLCKDTTLFKTVHPGIDSFLGNFDFGFSGNNEVLRLYNNNIELVDSVHYYDTQPWPYLPDGNGPSLELIDDSLDNDVPYSWRASYVIGGTPGVPNSIQAPVKLFINEFMADNDNIIADPQGEYDDWIELYNGGTQYINMGGKYITDDLNNPVEW